MNENQNIRTWLDTAVSGIRFGLDREDVRAELEAHIEDKTIDLMRIFPDMEETEARERALTGMGDPEELKISLAKVHRPWLGRLWMVSRYMLGILLALALAVMALCTPEDASKNLLVGGYRGYPMANYARDGIPDRPEPEKAELGGYTFQIIDTAYLDYPEESISYSDSIKVVFRVSSPRFWERVDSEAVYEALTVTLPDGTRYLVSQNRVRNSLDEEVPISMDMARWGICYRDFYIFIKEKDWSPGERVTLDFDFELGSFSLSAGVTEQVVWE